MATKCGIRNAGATCITETFRFHRRSDTDLQSDRPPLAPLPPLTHEYKVPLEDCGGVCGSTFHLICEFLNSSCRGIDSPVTMRVSRCRMREADEQPQQHPKRALAGVTIHIQIRERFKSPLSPRIHLFLGLFCLPAFGLTDDQHYPCSSTNM